MNVDFIEDETEATVGPPPWRRSIDRGVQHVRRRPVLSFCAVAALVALLGVLITTWRPTSGDTASSPFCTSAREAKALEPTGLAIDETDPAAVRQAWDAYLAKVDTATAQAPSSVHDDYVRQAAMLRSFAETLQHHDYDLGAAVADPEFLASLDDQEVESSRIAAETYLGTKCGA